jgi:hypothetical protein
MDDLYIGYMKPSSIGVHFISLPDSFDAYTMTMMQMRSGYEVMLDNKIELRAGLHDAGSTRPYAVRLVHQPNPLLRSSRRPVHFRVYSGGTGTLQ